ncbi:MAG: beta-propeller domain-containing protein [Deltaproteobacteria bacterium]|nr:beta-propeller domain-containing protein [Deltaproteobacteria bacterium]
MRYAPLAALAVFAAVGCSSTDSKEPVRYVSEGLTPMAGCADAEAAIRQAAIQQMNLALDQVRDQVLAFTEDQCSDMAMEDAAFGASNSSPSAGTSASQYSTTNNQVPGVDEADFIKNNGKYIYAAIGSTFRIVDAWPAEQAHEIANVQVEGTAKKLFVDGNRALVYSSIGPQPAPGQYGTKECTYGYDCQFKGDGNPTKLTVFDISNPSLPVRVRELRLSGSYITARRIGTAVHTVVSAPGPIFPAMQLTIPLIQSCVARPATWQLLAEIDELRATNQKIIEAAPISAWIPSAVDTVYVDGVPQGSTDVLAGCQGLYRSGLNDGTALLTVLSMDLVDPRLPSVSTIVSRPGAAYATADALYISVPHEFNPYAGWYPGFDGLHEASTVHKFELGNTPPSVAYVASGSVKGRVLNQFSMDEFSGHLRIATTTGRAGSPSVHSTVSVLKQEGAGLTRVGAVDYIAPREDIRSVRFAADRGFVVTFKKTDPLFMLDLSNPTAPTMLAELKVPGFSTYMHMMDANHLLTIGFDGDDQGQFAWFAGVSLQIFDVSDPSNLKRIHYEGIGTRGSASEAMTNHLAFNYFAPLKRLALPMKVCEGGSGGSYGSTLTFSGLMVYETTVESGFKLEGKVAHPNSVSGSGYANESCHDFWPYTTSEVKRSIFMESFVYSISEKRIKVNALANLGVDVAEIKF